MTWYKIMIKVFDGERNIPSPYDKQGFLEYAFVFSDIETRLGYLLIWCTITYKGIWVSRVKVPERDDDSIVHRNDFAKSKIPEIIHYQNIDTFTKIMEKTMMGSHSDESSNPKLE